MTLVLDPQTIRLLRHQPGTVMVQCDAVWPDQTPVVQSPRTILKQQLEAAARSGLRRSGEYPIAVPGVPHQLRGRLERSLS